MSVSVESERRMIVVVGDDGVGVDIIVELERSESAAAASAPPRTPFPTARSRRGKRPEATRLLVLASMEEAEFVSVFFYPLGEEKERASFFPDLCGGCGHFFSSSPFFPSGGGRKKS